MAWDAKGHLSYAGVHGDGAVDTPGRAGARFGVSGRQSPQRHAQPAGCQPHTGKIASCQLDNGGIVGTERGKRARLQCNVTFLFMLP